MAYNPQALGVEEIREAHAGTWRDAWRGLPDNPLATYWLLGESRRMKRLSVLRRSPALVVGIVAGALTLILIAVIQWDQGTLGGTPEYGWFWLGPYAGVVSAWLVAFLGGVAGAVRSAGEMLRRARKQSEHEPLDDMLIITPLSDHEIAIAALRVILPKLWWPVLGGAVLFWFHLFIAAAEFDPTRSPVLSLDSFNAQGILLSAPLSIGLLAASGLLGGLIVVLFYIIMGREIGSSLAAGGGAMLFTWAQLIWLPISVALCLGAGMEMARSGLQYSAGQALLVLASTLVLPLLPVALLLAASYLGRQAQWLRAALLLGGPILLPLILQFGLAIVFVIGAQAFEQFFNDGANAMIVLVYGRVWGMCLPFNASLLPPDLINPDTWSQDVGFTRLLWWLYPLALIAAQLLAVRLLAGEVLTAIRMRRQSASAA